MSEHAAALQTFNVELVKTLEDLKRRRHVLHEEIARDERHQQELERQLNSVRSELQQVNASLEKKRGLAAEYDRITGDADRAYQKILDSSQALLSVVKQQTCQLDGGAATTDGCGVGDR